MTAQYQGDERRKTWDAEISRHGYLLETILNQINDVRKEVEKINARIQEDEKETSMRRTYCEGRFARLETKATLVGGIFGAMAGMVTSMFGDFFKK